MQMLVLLGALSIVLVVSWWFALPRLRTLSSWDPILARLWAVAGNSRTIIIGYAAEGLGALDEAKVLDWSALIGSERAGRVMVIMGLAIIGLRLITRTSVKFQVR